QKPVIIIEPESGHFPESDTEVTRFKAELLKLGQASALTESIEAVLLHPSLPVDIRHNVKIFREKLAPWTEQQLQQIG
ncbi:MAG: fatty acid CoA ligase family protein, partial [Planctomycetota bacterium]